MPSRFKVVTKQPPRFHPQITCSPRVDGLREQRDLVPQRQVMGDQDKDIIRRIELLDLPHRIHSCIVVRE